MRILLDTTALYVATGIAEVAFTPKVQRLLEDPNTTRLISPVSINEVAIKANKGLTPLTRLHIQKLIIDLDLTVLPVIRLGRTSQLSI